MQDSNLTAKWHEDSATLLLYGNITTTQPAGNQLSWLPNKLPTIAQTDWNMLDIFQESYVRQKLFR